MLIHDSLWCYRTERKPISSFQVSSEPSQCQRCSKSDLIRTRHNSYRTEEAYLYWIRQYILFHGKRHPADVKPRYALRFRCSPGNLLTTSLISSRLLTRCGIIHASPLVKANSILHKYSLPFCGLTAISNRRL